MGGTTRVKSLGELRRVLKRDLKAKERAFDKARKRAARRAVAYVQKNMPVAFGETRATVHLKGFSVVVDAPWAAALERGSRPHWMPLEPLIKWVKLRGFQGLASAKSQARMPGTTTAAHAARVAGQLANADSGYSDGNDGFTTWSHSSKRSDASGPVQVAKAIQLAIALKGTKPTWFMRDSVARGFLREEIRKARDEKG
jgi:hypothetical protein